MLKPKIKKKITVGGIISGVCITAGIWQDAPGMLQDIFSKGPEWVTHPNTIWAIGVTVVYGLFVLWVWTHSEDEPENNSPEYKLFSWYVDALHRNMLPTGTKGKNRDVDLEHKLCQSLVDIEAPAMVESLLGRTVRNKFVKIADESKQKTNCPVAVASAMMGFLQGLSTRAEQARLKQSTPDTPAHPTSLTA